MQYHVRSSFNRSSARVVIGALALALGACDADSSGDQAPPAAGESRELTKLAELTGPTGNRIEFLALDEVSIVVTEHGTTENPPVTKSPEYLGLSAPEIHRKLAPGVAVPGALLEMQDRIDQLIARNPASTEEPTIAVEREESGMPAELDTLDQQLTARQFRSKFCQCGNWAKGNLCETDASGIRRLTTDDVKYFDANLNAISGDASFSIRTRKWWIWSDPWSATVKAGEERSFHFYSGVADWDISADAVGRRYHFAARAYNGVRQCGN
jgi:hypothetical protein